MRLMALTHCSFPYSFLRRATFAVALAAATLAGCSSAPVQSPPPSSVPPPNIDIIPEPVPKAEPRSSRGNPPFYEVLGKRYFVLPTSEGYVERGVASWYGPGFHAAQTSNGEKYDMYGMTAAHPTLPLPTYVRVTHLGNGRSVVVRVNDRGPFKDGRIIDLSYTAAAKLDMIKAGTAFVEVRALTPDANSSEPQPVVASDIYVQAGAFGNESNAMRLRDQLHSQGIHNAFVRNDSTSDRALFRVRVGPLANVKEFDRTLERLRSLGVPDARLASD